MLKYIIFSFAAFVLSVTGLFADDLNAVISVQKYSRSIHIMVMLLVGFGFLMVFVERYGRAAVTATYLLVSVSIPLYMVIKHCGIMGEAASGIDGFILAEFAAASLLICAGATLGRLKMIQYILLGVLFIPCYILNEWILLEGGFGMIRAGEFYDVGGSIVIHAFGALFGMGVVLSMTKESELQEPLKTSAISDRFSLLGSMILWIFWPSFCAALVSPSEVEIVAVNVFLALCGATISTYFASIIIRKKISVTDIANATLAGGVAIGSTCAISSPTVAFMLGILSGIIATIGFAVLQPRLEARLKTVDTCGVLNLHGLPGLVGGFSVLFISQQTDKGLQINGIGICVLLALILGYLVGLLLSLTGRLSSQYTDDEFITEDAGGPPV